MSKFGVTSLRIGDFVIHDQVLSGDSRKDTINFEVILRFGGRISVPRVGDLIHSILCEA